MKKTALTLLSLFFLLFSCNTTDDSDLPKLEEPKPEEPKSYIKTIDFSSSVSSPATINDLDVENGYLYFIHKIGIYRINLNSDANTAEFIIEDDEHWPYTLKVIGNNLYYQGLYGWTISDDIKQVDLNSISKGVKATYPIRGTSRSQLCKNSGKLYYTSSIDAYSALNNFYEFNPSTTHQLIATGDYIVPKNLRMVGQFLYFSSFDEIRKFDLNKPSEESSIVYTVPKQEKESKIRGFDIKDNIIYYTLESSNKLYSKDLKIVNQEPKVLGINNNKDGVGYGKLILSDKKLYVEKLTDSQLDVYGIK
ncbi:hypothetical protein [Flavobacterium sp. RS13.1]|uniref:hypothetical protein n=1 Tax=Flavobacterium sp. RS13.1 TaxID=3400345 RepID=UPI003AAB3869